VGPTGQKLKGSRPNSGSVAGILLLAGLSSRLGFPKALLTFGNQPLIRHVLRQALDSELEQVILVLGHKKPEILKRIGALKQHPKLNIIVNPDYMEGMSTSLRTGLTQVNPGSSGALFLLGDQPLLTSRVINKLIRAFRKDPTAIIVPDYGKGPGNPVLFPASFYTQLRRLSGDRGGRELIKKHADQVRFIPIRPRRIGWDVDTWEDYEKVKKWFQQR
jgi:molybdenum cofactor cytidylyltransferase